MNPAFFDDLNHAMDVVERDHPRRPMVLTGEGNTFSAGLDFEDVFPRFARADAGEIRAWFDRFRASILRVFAMPRRTVAAVNGNAYAGGLILAACCDRRVGAEGGARFALNEVPIGIPMPGVYIEIVRHAVGTFYACETVLDGVVYGVADAVKAGFLHEAVPRERVLEVAVERARVIPPDCFEAYAASKRTLQAPALAVLEGSGLERDAEALRVIALPSSNRAQQAALAKLKAKRG
jgi:enoyl-CoA hydratase